MAFYNHKRKEFLNIPFQLGYIIIIERLDLIVKLFILLNKQQQK